MPSACVIEVVINCFKQQRGSFFFLSSRKKVKIESIWGSQSFGWVLFTKLNPNFIR